jgi:hypothetical protein
MRVTEREIIEDPAHLLTRVWREYSESRKSRDQSPSADRISPFVDSENQDCVARQQVHRTDSIKAASVAGRSASRPPDGI